MRESSAGQRIEDFLSQKTIAVAGVSHTKRRGAANLVFKRLRAAGYRVHAINPNAESVEDVPCYPDVLSTPETVDGIVIATRPEVSEQIVRQCAKAGVPRVWMHRSFGQGSVSDEATQFCRENDISVIAGGCPKMYGKTSDFGHRLMRLTLGAMGRLPR